MWDLMFSGVDVNVQDNLGWSPLHEACNHGNHEAVYELLHYKPPRSIKSYFTAGAHLDSILVSFTLGPAYNEFIYNEHPAITSSFLCIIVIDNNVKKFGFNEHSLRTDSFFCIFLLVVSETQCIYHYIVILNLEPLICDQLLYIIFLKTP